ncbi:MAG: hypothetical protein WCY88_08900 [Spongiibacteraceae bacterium]
MQPDNLQPNNVIQLNSFKKDNQQELIDDIGARAFLFIRDAAEQMGIPVKDVIVEHMLGLALVMSEVEGESETHAVLKNIGAQITAA